MTRTLLSAAELEARISERRLFLAQCSALLATSEYAAAVVNDPRAIQQAVDEGATSAELERLRGIIESNRLNIESIRQMISSVTEEIIALEIQLLAARDRDRRRSAITLHSDHDDDKHNNHN